MDSYKIFKQDARDFALDAVLDGLKADCVVTDPPYKLESGGCTQGGLHERFGKSKTKYGNSGDLVECDITWPEIMEIIDDVMECGHAYVMCNNRHIANCQNAALAAGLRFHNWLVWDKGTATPNRWYMKNCEFTGLFFKGTAQRINNCSAKQLLYCPQVDETVHPTEKPVLLMQHYIENSTQPGDLVFDPFMGTGTTGVACIRSGRRFVGVEISDEYYGIAEQRLERALQEKRAAQYSQVNMF